MKGKGGRGVGMTKEGRLICHTEAKLGMLPHTNTHTHTKCAIKTDICIYNAHTYMQTYCVHMHTSHTHTAILYKHISKNQISNEKRKYISHNKYKFFNLISLSMYTILWWILTKIKHQNENFR